MSVSESWTPSRRMRSAASAERDRMERELTRLAERERQLAEEMATLGVARGRLEEQLVVLRHFAEDPAAEQSEDDSPRLRVLHGGGPTVATAEDHAEPPRLQAVRGARIREIAVQVLSATPEGQSPIHYKTWFELLRARGFVPAGKDPLASFLTQIGRSPVVRRSSAAGTYTLDFEFPARARDQLTLMRDQLQAATELSAHASIKEIADARTRRGELAAAVDAAERAFEEAIRSLASPDS